MTKSAISKARFVRDGPSRLLALSDALASGRGASITQAFLDVAHAIGIARIARKAGLSQSAIYAALSDPAQLDTAVLACIVEAMLQLEPKPSSSDEDR